MISCLSSIPKPVAQAIATRLGVDQNLIETSKQKDKNKFDIIGTLQILSSKAQKPFEQFSDSDWNGFIDSNINEIMGKIKSSDKYDALSIMANLELNGLHENDYISFVTDNRNLLNSVIEITDDNRDEIQDLTNSTIFKLFGTEIGEGFFKDSNKIILSFPDLKNQVFSGMDYGYTDEMQDIKAKAIADGTFMKAPNGEPTNLENEKQWLQVRTKAFKEWFGDWAKHAIIYNELKDIQNERSRTNAERLSIQRMDMAELSKSEKILKDAISIFERGNDSSDREAEQGVGRKEQLIEKFAKENNVWIDDVDSTMQANFGEQIGQGGESIVYEGEDGTVVKSIGADYYNGDIQLLLDRILIHNYLFPETALTDIGFGRDSLGNIRVIAAQKFIKGSEPSREEIVEYAKNRGFKTEDGNTYYYKGIKISDLNQLNLIKAENGQLFVIDNELSFVTNEQFDQMFGQVSKVVDENGEPLVVYHGDIEGISEFKPNKGKYDNSPAYYFTPNVNVAIDYANKKSDDDEISSTKAEITDLLFRPSRNEYEELQLENAAKYLETLKSSSVYAVFLNIRNIKTNISSAEIVSGGTLVEKYSKNYDGLVSVPLIDAAENPNSDDESLRSVQYVVFNSNQIKSATDNNGEFSAEDNNIYHNRTLEEIYNALLEYARQTTTQDNFQISLKEFNKRFGTDFQYRDNKRKEVRFGSGRLHGVSIYNANDTKVQAKTRIDRAVLLDYLTKKFNLKTVVVNSLRYNANFGKLSNCCIVGDTVYLRDKKVYEPEQVTEEFLHPCVHAIYDSNKELSQKLLDEAKRDFPDLAKQIDVLYADQTEDVRNEELITHVLSKYLNKEISDNGTNTRSLVDYIHQFFDKIFEFFKDLFGNVRISDNDRITISGKDIRDALSYENLAQLINSKQISFNDTLKDDDYRNNIDANPISTQDNPIQIYSDGSDIKGTGNIGYGSVFEHNGKQYGISGTETGEEVSKLREMFPDAKFSNPTMEMLALATTLEHFAKLGIGEHLEINQDYKGAVNYGGLWDHSEGSDQREPKAWKAREPYIKHLVERAEAAIEKIEENGGTVKIRWVKGHAGDRMNDMADSYAKNRNNFNTINDAYKTKDENSNKDALERHVDAVKKIIAKFKKQTIKHIDFENNHQYYALFDENGNKFTKEDASLGVVKFIGEDNETHYGIPADKSPSQFIPYKGQRSDIATRFGTDYDSIGRAYFNGKTEIKDWPETNFNKSQLSLIKADFDSIKQQLDKIGERHGGYEVITDEFAMSSSYVDKDGKKHYAAGTPDIVIVCGDGSVIIFDMKTKRLADSSAGKTLDVDTKVKYKIQIDGYTGMLNSEIEQFGMQDDMKVYNGGIILSGIIYPKGCQVEKKTITFNGTESKEDDTIGRFSFVPISDENTGSRIINVTIDKDVSKKAAETVIKASDLPKIAIATRSMIFNPIKISEEEDRELNESFGTEQYSVDDNVTQEDWVDETFEPDLQDEIDIESNLLDNAETRPVTNLEITRTGRAAVKFAVYIARKISNDPTGDIAAYYLGEKYGTPNKDGKMPLYGKSVEKILQTPGVYPALFRQIIIDFNNFDNDKFGSYPYLNKQWKIMHVRSIMNSSFAEFKRATGLSLDANTHTFNYQDIDPNAIDEMYEMSGQELEESIDAYDIDKRTIDQIRMMPAKLRQMLSMIPIVERDEHGYPITDEYGDPVIKTGKDGMPIFLDIEYLSATLFSKLSNLRRRNEMIDKLKQLSSSYSWMPMILEQIDKNSSSYDKAAADVFFKTFRKSRYSYTTIERKRDADRTQSYVMKILGKDSKSEKIIANVTQRFQNGDETALLGISTSTNDDPNTLVINTDFLKRFHDGINDIRNSRETDPTRFINAMYTLGISLDNEHLLTEGQLIRNKGELKEKMLNQLVKIDNLLKSRRGKISIEEYVNNIKDLSKLVSFTMDETNDISVHDMSTGKTFQRYSEPSFIHDTIDDLADETTGESLLTSLESKYVRFPQFGRNSNGQRIFLCSWLNDIKKNGHLRKYLKVHSNTSTDKKAFTKQSDKQYLLSMIKAFFAPQEMYNSFEGQYDKNVALFRVLLYSDKNSQEFVQFRPTGDAYIDLNDKEYDSKFYKQFIGYAKEYLYFELNRMNSVYHQLKEGNHENDVQNYNISSKDGAAIKEKITFGKITQRNKQNGQIELSGFIQKSGLCFKYFSYLNGELANKNSKFGQNVIKYLNGDKTVKEAIVSDFEKLFKQNMESGFNEFMEYTQKMFPKNQLGSVTQVFNGKTSNQIERLMRWFYFNDNLAAMNICNLTVIDPAFSKDTIDFQKRYAQVHSQTQRLDKDAEFQIDDNPRNTKPYSKDGKFRFVIIDDQIVSSQLKHAVEKVFADLMEKAKKAAEKRGVNPQDDLEYIKYKTLHDTIPAMFDKSTGDGVNVTDGQAYNSPTSLWKKMGMLGQVDDEFRRAYDAIRSGDMGLGNFKIVLQSLKPFVYGMSEQFEDGVIRSAANTKLVPIQLKDSESLLFLAGAILEGANKLQRSSKQNPLLALYNFMEESHFGKGNEHTLENYNGIGIDSVVFKSCVKVGASGVLNIAGKTYDEVMEELEKCYVDGEYNKTYVHELDYDAYGIQQNVPQHMQDHEQPLGSQERIISMTDIPDDFKCTIDGVDYTKESIIHEYADLIAKDYNGGIHSLMKKFGAVKDNKTGLYVINRSRFNLYLSKLLTEKIANDSKYSQELYHAFTSLINKNVGDGKKGYEFIAPIGDPAISEIVYGVLFTEIKHAINEQNVPGGPVVQMSNFGLNSDLHITDSDGKVVSVDKNGKIGGLDYTKGLVFEAYVTCPTAEFEQKITKPDGTLMTMNEIEGLVKKGELSSEELNFIAYRIPTEDKYSIFRCKIKGFIPRQQGELIILPSEITLLSGTDFDIDKMYCWFKNGKNKIEKIKDTDEKARAARRDRMFDIQWAVMGHESSVEKQLNPGGYDVLKKLARDVNPEYKSGSKDIFTVKTQVDMRKLNAAGKQFVGIAALNNVCHGMMSFCHVKINSLPAFEIQFNTPNGESKTVNSHDLVDSNSEFEMDSVTSQFDKSRISRTLSMFVGAAADNAKEALLGALNITPVTANYAMSFIRMGFPIQVVVYMMNNPLIKRLSDQAEIEGKRFEKVIMENYHSYPRPVNTYTISENELIGRIKSGDEEVKPIDVAVLDLLAESTQICSELSSINQLMSLNSMKNTIGPSLADALNKRMHLESLVDNIKSGDSVFAEDTYDKITQSLPFINPLMKCYTSVIDKLCETFSPVFTNEFMTILKSLHKKGFYIDKKNLKSLMSGYFIYNAKMLGLFGDFGQTQKLDLNESDEKFSVRKRMALLNDFPNTLLRKKSKYGKNEFIRSLYFEDMTKSMKIPAVKYNNAGSSRSWSDDMSASWAELVQTTDVGLLNLNKLLFEYMSTRYGFFWGPYSPVSITPMLAKLKIQNQEAGTKYSDIFDPLKQNGFRDILMMSCFMDQFSRNNPKCGLWKDVAVMYDKRGPYIKYSDYSENQFGYSSDRYKNLFRPIRESMFQGEDGIMYIRLSEVERLGIDNNFMEYEPGMVNLKTVVDVQNFSGMDFSEEDEDYETEDTTEDENEYMNPTFGFEDNDELDVLPEQRLNDLAKSLSGIFERHGLNENVNVKGKILTRIEIKEKLEDMLNAAVRTERISQSAANDIKNESNKEIDKPC